MPAVCALLALQDSLFSLSSLLLDSSLLGALRMMVMHTCSNANLDCH